MPAPVLSSGMEWLVRSESTTPSPRCKTRNFCPLQMSHWFFCWSPFALYTATSVLTTGLCRSIDSHAPLTLPMRYLDSLNTTWSPWGARSLALDSSIEPPSSPNVASFSLHHIEHAVQAERGHRGLILSQACPGKQTPLPSGLVIPYICVNTSTM